MDIWIEKYKGVAPGSILNRTLNQRKLKQAVFARQIELPVQTLNAIIKGKRRMTPEVAFKIDSALGLEESTMAVLQAIYDTKLVQQELNAPNGPDLSKLRHILFWDTDVKKIDWKKHCGGVIRRVFERGNQDEKSEIVRFYGQKVVSEFEEKMRVPTEGKKVYYQNH